MQTVKDKIDLELNNKDRWATTQRLASEHSGPVPLKFDETIQRVTDEYLPRFVEAFRIDYQIKADRNLHPQSLFADPTVREKLGLIYKNHLCNEFHAALCEAGLDQKSAYLTMSYALKSSIYACGEYSRTRPYFNCMIEPNRGVNYDDQSIAKEIARMQHYWRDQQKELQCLYGRQAPLNSSITRTSDF